MMSSASSQDFFSYDREELAALLEEQLALPAYRAEQLFDWVYRKDVRDFSRMSNIAHSARELLATFFTFPALPYRERHISKDGTRKYLFETERGDLIEAVMIKQTSRMTLCVSSQVGCAMACTFCRTGTMGLNRNLTTSEIVRQVLAVREDAKSFGDKFNNIVFMGMGEPLHNFDAVTRALKILRDAKGLEIGPRKITISSVGLIPAIERFLATGIDVNLALSLNATSDEVRSRIMPINKRFPISQLIELVRKYPSNRNRKVTIEYVMLRGINDTPQDLARLPKLLRGLPVKVNLIPYNTNAGLGYETPQRDTVSNWHRTLMGQGLQTTVRWSKGSDIDAACGQLVTTSTRVKRRSLAQVAA